MGGVALLAQAARAGLKVTVRGSKLEIRGPRRAEATALQLLEHKDEVIEALAPRPRIHVLPLPCGMGHRVQRWWRFLGGSAWICEICHPPARGREVMRISLGRRANSEGQ